MTYLYTLLSRDIYGSTKELESSPDWCRWLACLPLTQATRVRVPDPESFCAFYIHQYIENTCTHVVGRSRFRLLIIHSIIATKCTTNCYYKDVHGITTVLHMHEYCWRINIELGFHQMYIYAMLHILAPYLFNFLNKIVVHTRTYTVIMH